MTKVDPKVVRGQLVRTVETLEAEARLLKGHVEEFIELVDHQGGKAADTAMKNANLTAKSMGPMLNDVVRYTTSLKAVALNSRGVRKGTT